MADILSAPQNYSPKELLRAQNMEDGWALSLMLTPSAIDNLDNLRDEIALTANIQDSLKNLALSYEIDCSVYAAFEEGYGLIVDTAEDDMREDYFDNPNKPYLEFNFKERAWYKNAKEKNGVAFSDTMLNISVDYSEPIVVCSAPITLNGEFIGVSGMGFSVKDIAEYYLEQSVDITGFWFLMNNNGQVIISSKSKGDLSVKDDFPDLRKSSGQSLAVAEEKLERGEESLNLALFSNIPSKPLRPGTSILPMTPNWYS